MSNTSITYFVGACAGVFSFAAYVAFVAVPAWTAYSRVWQRVAAVFLTLYVLATMVGIGVLIGVLVTLNWSEIG
jgi:hypothetical protein